MYSATLPCIAPREHGKLLQMQRPLSVNMFANSSTECWETVAGARIFLGNCWYTTDLIIIPGAMTEYVLGEPFMVQYAAKLDMSSFMLSLGVTRERMIRPPRPNQRLPANNVPLVCTGKKVVYRH